MPQHTDTDDYRSLFLADVPMLDVRAPGEFNQGAFPTSQNLPLMDDDERAQVGICYKRHGQQAAIALGHKLVAGDVRKSRLAHWCDFTNRHPSGYLYCFRGGLRSQIVQQWLREEGIDYPLVRGGYKALRRFLLDELERSVAAAEIILVGGKTGTGKTRVISQLARSVDLERLAGHRGSAFGQLPEPQPTQIDFENALSISWLKLLATAAGPVYVEDEGRLIGRLHLPAVLREKMKTAPILVVEQTLEQRIDIVIEDYVLDLGRRYTRWHGAEGAGKHRDKLQSDLSRIRKRLGGERWAMLSAGIDAAFEQQWLTGELTLHREWTGTLLRDYYDPMYDYQLGQRLGRELFRGDRAAVIEHVATGR